MSKKTLKLELEISSDGWVNWEIISNKDQYNIEDDTDSIILSYSGNDPIDEFVSLLKEWSDEL